jgi:diguanylate cyclase (GGDEF)-like protein/PAS domain S-box-containing protein
MALHVSFADPMESLSVLMNSGTPQPPAGPVRAGGWYRLSIAAFLTLSALLLGQAQADALRIEPTVPRPSLAGHLSLLIDDTGRLTFPEARALGQAGQFRPVAGDEIAPGFLPTGAAWTRFTLERPADAPADWWLVILHEPLDTLDLYLLGPDGSQQVRHGGRALPFAQREANWHGHAFKLSLEPPGQYQVYLRAATRGVFRVPLWLRLPGDFERLRVVEPFFYAATFGIAAVALLLSLFRTLRYRSVVDGCYALYLLSLETANFVLYGYFQQFGISDDLSLRASLGWSGYLAAALAFFWFVVVFVVWPPALARRLRRAATALTAASVLGVALVLALDAPLIAAWTMANGLLLAAATFAVALTAAVRRWPGGLAFVLAFAPMIVALLLNNPAVFGLPHADFLVSRGLLYAATVIHILLLFGIILNRDAGLRRERERQLAEERRLLEQRVAERTRNLAEALAFNETVLLNSPLPMGVYAPDGGCVLANDALADLVGTSREVVLASNFNAISAWQRSGLLDACRAALADHQTRQVELNGVSSSGKEFWADAKITPRNLNGREHLLIQFVDLTARKRLEDELRHIAFHDSLTLLPNRRLLLDRLQQAVLRARRLHHHGALLFLDLDRFKQLNDTAGHDVGDRLLVAVAERLRHNLRADDTAARLGGDEFVVLLEGLGADSDQAARRAAQVASQVRAALSLEYQLGDIRYQGSASIGVMLFSGAVSDPDQILKEADGAMYAAKRTIAEVAGSPA